MEANFLVCILQKCEIEEHNFQEQFCKTIDTQLKKKRLRSRNVVL